jgi:hypothetical protein
MGRVSTTISIGMAVIGVTLFLSAPTVFSLARLSELHARVWSAEISAGRQLAVA